MTSAISRASVTPSGAGASTAAQLVDLKDLRERRNWLIHQLYIRQEYVSCLSVIEAQLRETDGTCEYALYVKGLMKRMEGKLMESLTLLQAAVLVSPENVANRKQLGRALHLIGRHKEGIEVFREAENLLLVKGAPEDWELSSSIGVCYTYMKQYDKAVESFLHSISVQRNDSTFLHLGRTLVLMKDYTTAVQVYEEAVVLSPDNPELLSLLGQLHLQLGNPAAAFDHLGRCLALDPTNAKAIVTAASMIQDNGDFDVALTKYRIAVSRLPDSPQVWNNIGACFFGKRNTYAAVAALRKANFLAPLEWIITYNLGIVLLTCGRYVSAFHYLSAAISLHADYAPAYMFLGVCLSLLNDVENACQAYEKALSIDNDFLVRLNYAVTLWNSGMAELARQQFQLFLSVWEQLTPEQKREQSSAVPGVVREMEASMSGASPVLPATTTTTGAGAGATTGASGGVVRESGVQGSVPGGLVSSVPITFPRPADDSMEEDVELNASPRKSRTEDSSAPVHSETNLLSSNNNEVLQEVSDSSRGGESSVAHTPINGTTEA